MFHAYPLRGQRAALILLLLSTTIINLSAQSGAAPASADLMQLGRSEGLPTPLRLLAAERLPSGAVLAQFNHGCASWEPKAPRSMCGSLVSRDRTEENV